MVSQVVLLRIASFWLVESWVILLIAHTAAFGKKSLTYIGRAFYSLLTDMTEAFVGIAILCHCLSRFYPLPADWFEPSLNGKWQFDVCSGLPYVSIGQPTLTGHPEYFICSSLCTGYCLKVLSNQMLHQIQWQWHSMRCLFQLVLPCGRRLYSVGSLSLH